MNEDKDEVNTTCKAFELATSEVQASSAVPFVFEEHVRHRLRCERPSFTIIFSTSYPRGCPSISGLETIRETQNPLVLDYENVLGYRSRGTWPAVSIRYLYGHEHQLRVSQGQTSRLICGHHPFALTRMYNNSPGC